MDSVQAPAANRLLRLSPGKIKYQPALLYENSSFSLKNLSKGGEMCVMKTDYRTRRRVWNCRWAVNGFAALLLLAGTSVFSYAPSNNARQGIATVTVGGSYVDIEPHVTFDKGVIRIAGPDDYALTRHVPPDASEVSVELLLDAKPVFKSARHVGQARFSPESPRRETLPDGQYVYEAVFSAADGSRLRESGVFYVQDGMAQKRFPAAADPAEGGGWADTSLRKAALGKSLTENDSIQINDSQGDGYTSLRLDEDDPNEGNPGFWAIANRSTVFEIHEGFPSGDGSSGTPRVSVTQGGKVGIGTSAPEDELHVIGQARITGPEPRVYFENTTDSNGSDWMVWESAGALRVFEAGGGTRMQFEPGGNVGIGSFIGSPSPSRPLHVRRTDGEAGLLIEEANSTTKARELFKLSNNGSPFFIFENTDIAQSYSFAMGATGHFLLSHQQTSGVQMRLTPDGNMTIAGSLNEGSSRAIKDGITPIDPATLLAKLEALPVSEWSYQDVPGSRHVGPMAEDFHAVFGFGPDDQHIAPRDLAGVALAAAKALKAETGRLEAENRALAGKVAKIEQMEGRLEALESRLAELAR